MNYTIKVNRKQLELFALVLEQHTRIRCGHMDTSTIPALDEALEAETTDFEEYLAKRRAVEAWLTEIKKVIFPELGNGNYGIGHDNDSDICYEMYKMILLQFDKERRGNENYTPNVHSTEPLHFSDEPLIKITPE